MEKENEPGFYTMKGYARLESNQITASMEDYLEMIYRICGEEKKIRLGKIADMLHVKPSSASKMVANLKKAGLVQCEKYGVITLTEAGVKAGDYLILRHGVLNQLLCMINETDNELEQVEKIEHFIDMRTIENMRRFLEKENAGKTES